MAEYAEIDVNKFVKQILVIDDSHIDGQTFLAETCALGGTWQKVSNNAGIGYTFDGVGFAAPQPYPSWTLDEVSYLWQAPTPMPTDGKFYNWDEATLSWVEIAALSN